MKTPLLFILAGLTAAPIVNAIILDIDGGDPTDEILGEFPDYLLADNTKDIPDASQTDGMVTLTLRDNSIPQWNNAGYYFSEGYEINWHPGGSDLTSQLDGKGSANLSDSLTAGLFYTIQVESTTAIDINNVTVQFFRNDRTGPPRRYYILYDADQNGYDAGDVIADTASLPDAEAATGLIPFDHFGPDFTKTLSPDTSISNVTSTEFRFYASNTPNPAGNTHWFYASVDYTAVPEPETYAALLGVLSLSFIFWQRRKRHISDK